MFRGTKIIGIGFVVFTIVTFVHYRYPMILSSVKSELELTDGRMNIFLTATDIIICFIFNAYMVYENRVESSKCRYEFSSEDNCLGIENYVRFPTDIDNAYIYNYSGSDEEVEKNCFVAEIHLNDCGTCSVSIPITVKVITKLLGERLEFSKLKMTATHNGKKVCRYKDICVFTEIILPIANDKKYLLRLKIICGCDLEPVLLESRFDISFLLTMTDDRHRSYRKYFRIKIQKASGESKILSVAASEKINWLSC